MTWNDAVEEAMKPTELDLVFENADHFLVKSPRLNNAQTEVTDFNLIRERAALAYAKAHEGEEARVSYIDPENAGLTYTFSDKLTTQVVNVPVFLDRGITKSWRGLVVGNAVVPLAGVASMRVAGDDSVVVLS